MSGKLILQKWSQIGSIFIACFLCPVMFAFATPPDIVTYTVKPGESLAVIGDRLLENPEDWKKIAQHNQITDSSRILPGTVLQIPEQLLKKTNLSAKVIYTRGDVRMRVGHASLPTGGVTVVWKTLRKDHRIPPNHFVKSSSDGRTIFQYENGDRLTLWANTDVEVQTAQRFANLMEKYHIHLLKGRVELDQAPNPGIETQFEISTPSAIIQAKETHLRVSLDGSETTRIEVFGGNAEVVGNTGKSVTVTAGQGTMVKKNSLPITPVNLPPPPELVSPRPMYTKSPVEFWFERVPNAAYYHVLIARDEDFNEVGGEIFGQPNTVFSFPNLEDGPWFLTVTSIDWQGLEGIAADPFTFSVSVHH